jgi:hypothetical protein
MYESSLLFKIYSNETTLPSLLKNKFIYSSTYNLLLLYLVYFEFEINKINIEINKLN